MFKPYPKPAPKIKIRKKLSRVRKTTGEMHVFEMIWNERPRKSQVSNDPLGDQIDPWLFSHILPKGRFPRFRLLKKNIVLKTPTEHTLWQYHKEQIRNKPEWQWIFDLEEELKKEYEKLYPSRAKKIIDE